MSKSKSITDLVTELQEETERLKGLQQLFNSACKKEFGYDVKTIHTMIYRQQQYERKMAERRASQQGQQVPHERSE